MVLSFRFPVVMLILLGAVFAWTAEGSFPRGAWAGGVVDLPSLLEVLEDPGGGLTIDAVSTDPVRNRFRPIGPEGSYLGFRDSVWWGRFALTNTADHPVTWVIELDHAVMDRVDLFVPAEGGGEFLVKRLGDSVVGRDMEISGPRIAFKVDLEAAETRTVYLRLAGESSLSFDGRVWPIDEFVAHQTASIDGNAIFFGVLLAGALYSLALFFVFREQSYLLFTLAVTAVGVYQAENRGYMAAYMWPESTWIANLSILLSIALTVFALARFTSRFLRLEENAPNANALFRAMQALGVIGAILAFIDYQMSAIILVLGMSLGNLAALIVSLVLVARGIEGARPYALCWSVFGVFAMVFGAEKLGLIEVGRALDMFFRVSVSATVILFAVVFSERYRKQAQANQRRYKKARDEAIAASRAKSTFLATMSHELRTPLNAIIGFSEIIASNTGNAGNTGKKTDADKNREYAEDILSSGRHLLSIVNNLLEISRIEAGHVELDEKTVELPALLRRCLNLVQERADNDEITLKMDLDAPLPMLHCDEKLVQKVLVNLLLNAVKFTPVMGRVTVQARVEPDGLLSISVSDTGVGIAKEDIRRVLEPFTQIGSHLTREHGGLGLGLAIVNAILGLHDGHLVVESEVGKGSTFKVRFPAERLIRVP